MSGHAIIMIALVVLGAGYVIYGRYLAKKWGIDPKAKTPAYEHEDGVDYMPSNRGVVFGHQFASIAGAGPINGPIQAAVFGWVPVLLWVLLGGIFFGAVQDFSAMYASVKNKGRTIGYIIELYIGKQGKKLFLAFTWLFSVLVIAAFADVVAKTFSGVGGTNAENLAGGQVSTITLMFTLFAVVLGVILRKFRLPASAQTCIAIFFLVAAILLGMKMPICLSAGTWHIIVFVYVAIACIAPVWILLQPRDYLNSFLLVAMIVAALIGIIVANPKMNLDAFSGFNVSGQSLFPYLFVTIACGAISGFHSLVSSGTASKQIKSETDMLPVSFGAMLIESLLAVIALVAVGAKYTSAEVASAGTPSVIFASAISSFLSVLHIPENISYSLITLSVSAFALTSLDSVARVGRLAWQELFLDSSIKDEDIHGLLRVLTDKHFATGFTLILAYGLAKVGYMNIWPLFGAANQMLGAISLITCAVYFRKTKRQGAYLWVPMILMLLITFTTLVLTIWKNVSALITGTAASLGGVILQTAFAIAIFVLGLIVAERGMRKLTEKN